MNVARDLTVALVATVSVVPCVAAQTQPTPRQHERAGRYEEAARGFALMLADEPANLTALLGLERLLGNRLERSEEVWPYLERAIEAAPQHEQIREIAFRIAASAFGPDSVTAVIERWIAALPLSANPYRQYAFWLADIGELENALAVLDRGDDRITDARLSQYRAQILIRAGDWLAAASHWRQSVELDPAFAQTAGASLSRAPLEYRETILQAVVGDEPSTAGRLLSADLLVRWGRPEEGWALLDASLPASDDQSAAILRRFADRAGQMGTLAGARARGFALERLAERQVGAEAARTRVEAARAFADAGDLPAAQRLLNRSRSRTTEADEAVATATLIRVLTDAGQLEDAEARFREWEPRLRGDDVDELRHRLAWAWILRPEMARAERILAADSSVTAMAIFGWIALYRGELAVAKENFSAAGPATQSREEATRRASMLVLLQRVKLQRAPELGAALLLVAQGDTTTAVARLETVARSLPAKEGRAEVFAHAGQLLHRQRDYEGAIRLYESAFSSDTTGPSAPAAELALAVALTELGREDDAVPRLEHLILTYQESALVPQARRLLDQISGMIPKS